jgi:uncharacterized protein YndB with AHSA1/START domain
MTDDNRPTERCAEETIAFECDLPEAPDKVWRALTVPELLSTWLMPNDIRPEEGRRFSFKQGSEDGELIQCEVLAVEPHRLIRYSWRDREAWLRSLDSTVTFELTGTDEGGTHLRIVHRVVERGAGADAQPPMTMMAGNPPATSAANANLQLRMQSAA